VSIYLLTLVVYLMTDVIACWGLNLQFGEAGLYSFGFIVCQAAGAYTVGLLTLGSAAPGQTYFFGAHLAFPVPIICSAAVGGVFGVVFGVAALRRIRLDYQALAMLVIAVIANYVVNGVTGFLDGPIGLVGIPLPVPGFTQAPSGAPGWGYAVVCVPALIVSFWIVWSLSRSPAGRAMRTARSNEAVARATGKSVAKLWLGALFWGGVLGGLSGGLLVAFIGAWAPASWEFTETFVLLTALIVGGVGNVWGAALGALLVPVAFAEGSRYLPAIPGSPDLGPSLEWIAVGLVTVLFLWFRPAGLIRERRRKYAVAAIEEVGEADQSDTGGPPMSAGVASADDVASTGLTSGSAATQPARATAATREVTTSSPVTRGGPPAIEVEDVVVRFGGVTALDRVSLVVPEGSVTAIVGPNGAGKSTLVGVIAGSQRPASGHVRMFGDDVTAMKSHARARHGLARSFQISGEVDGLTVFENVMIGEARHEGEGMLRALAGRWAWRDPELRVTGRAAIEVRRVGLEDRVNAVTSELSGGQRRLMEIARCLVGTPRVVLLDEPMAGVNPRMADAIIEHIRRLKDRGLTVLLVEHELEVVEDVADRIVLLSDGRTVMQGDTGEVLNAEALREVYLGV